MEREVNMLGFPLYLSGQEFSVQCQRTEVEVAAWYFILIAGMKIGGCNTFCPILLDQLAYHLY